MTSVRVETTNGVRAAIKDEAVARDVLIKARADLDAAARAISPFQPGDVVEARIRGDWLPAIVREVKPTMIGADSVSFWYDVSLRRKAGGWRDQTVSAFGYVRRPEAETGPRVVP